MLHLDSSMLCNRLTAQRVSVPHCAFLLFFLSTTFIDYSRCWVCVRYCHRVPRCSWKVQRHQEVLWVWYQASSVLIFGFCYCLSSCRHPHKPAAVNTSVVMQQLHHPAAQLYIAMINSFSELLLLLILLIDLVSSHGSKPAAFVPVSSLCECRVWSVTQMCCRQLSVQWQQSSLFNSQAYAGKSESVRSINKHQSLLHWHMHWFCFPIQCKTAS